MKKSKKSNTTETRIFDANTDAVYSIDVIGELVGMSPDTILEYHERGLVSSVSRGAAGPVRFDDEGIRTLRRIDRLRTHYEMNLRSLGFALRLLEEVERLRSEQHRRH